VVQAVQAIQAVQAVQAVQAAQAVPAVKQSTRARQSMTEVQADRWGVVELDFDSRQKTRVQYPPRRPPLNPIPSFSHPQPTSKKKEREKEKQKEKENEKVLTVTGKMGLLAVDACTRHMGLG